MLERNRTTTDLGHSEQPAPLIAIASVIVSMSLIAIGNGLMFAYIPVRLGADGFDPTWA
ncbi:MFS transporter, partial [Pseudomonas sp. MPR-LB3]